MFKELGLKCEVDQEDKTNSLSPFVAFYDHLGDMATSRAYIYHGPELVGRRCLKLRQKFQPYMYMGPLTIGLTQN